MSRRTMRSVCVLVLMAWFALSGVAAAAPIFERGKLRHDNLDRTFLYFLPRNVPKDAKLPLVLLLHGGLSSGAKVLRDTTLPYIAERNGFILVAPDGLNETWNDGRDGFISNGKSDADDTGFLLTLLKSMITDHNADPNHIFIAGISNGGMMTYRMICQRGDLFAGAAVFSATVPRSWLKDCPSNTPVPLLMTLGTDDPLVSWQGGIAKRNGVDMASAMDTFTFFQVRAACKSTDKVEVADRTPQDGSNITQLSGKSCKAPVVFLVVNRGGHQWLNHQGVTGLQVLLGNVNRDLDSGEVIWEFFQYLDRRATKAKSNSEEP